MSWAACAAWALWRLRKLRVERFWTFAYGDGDGRHLPRASPAADLTCELPDPIWTRKRRIVTETYGFAEDSFEARAAPRREAFFCRDLESLADAPRHTRERAK